MQEKKEEDLQQALNKVFEVGIDEVGRGAIFGPVFAAAVVLTEKNKFILKQIEKISKSGEEKIQITIEANANLKDNSTDENNDVLFTDKKDEIELTDELNNARKKRRRSSASIE